VRYTTEQIEQIAEKLRALPAVEKPRKQMSKQEAIKALSKEIIALQKRGYTLEQVAEILRSEGVEITTATLRNYMQRAKDKTTGKIRRKDKRNTQTHPAPPPTVQNTTIDVADKAKFTPLPDSPEI